MVKKVIRGGLDATDAMSAVTQRQGIKEVYKRLNLNYKAICHVTRGSSARMAEFVGTEDNQIRRQGLWNSQAMENCYLTTIPREAVRGLAGFDPKGASFNLSRSALIPPKALSGMVFPWIDEWTAKRDSGLVVPTICLDSFLKTLDYLRIVLLQDSVCLKEVFPDLFLWNHALFSSPEYLEFADQLKKCIDEAPDSEEIRIREALPALNAHLKEEFSSLRSGISSNNVAITQTNAIVENTYKALHDLFAGRQSININVNSSNGCQDPSRDIVWQHRDTMHPIQAETGMTERFLLQQVVNAIWIVSVVIPSAQDFVPLQPPNYKMSRSIATAHDLWREWSTGIGGGPSVMALEEAWGAKWRRDKNECRFFNRRKIIIDEINRMVEYDSVTVEEAIRILDGKMAASKKSLDYLQKQIK